MPRKAWPLLALASIAALIVLPSIAGASGGRSISLNSPDNKTPSAWFVQLSGSPTIDGGTDASVQSAQSSFFTNAKSLGLNVKERHSFGTLWNGVSVNVPLSQVGSLLAVPGVSAIYPVRPFSLPPAQQGTSNPNDVSSNAMIGTDPTNGGVGSDIGQGVKVAVIDSGIDYTNPDLGGCFGPGCRVIGGWDFVGDSYDDTPTDNAYQPVPHPDANPAPCDPNVADAVVSAGNAADSDAGHGTHVAGIIGAKSAGPGGVTGVAPGVKFLSYRVFGCDGSTDNDNIVAALERAYKDGAQVVNMSIGDDYAAWPEEPTAQTSDELAKHGVVVVAAEGNAGSANTALFSGGDPGTGNNVIAVGSIDNNKAFSYQFDVNGTLHPYTQAVAAPTAPISGSGELVTVPDTIGCAAEPAGSLTGKIALIKRGTCTFFVKAANAQAAGAIGVILYNNSTAPVNPTVAGTSPINIPVVITPLSDGTTIAAIAGTRTLTWTNQGTYLDQATGGQTSSFSSWGPTAELGLKPDVSAPGGSIRSTWPMTQYGGHNVISGTSMASPHVAGAAALLLAAGRPAITVDSLLSNYAVPPTWNQFPGGPYLESPLRAGAGLIQVDKSLSATVGIAPAKISFGEGLGGSQILAFVNAGNKAETYVPQWNPAISPMPLAAPNDTLWPSDFDWDFASETVTFSSQSITVPAHGVGTVTVSATIPATVPDGELYDGYVQFVPQDDSATLTVPYVGYKGDYQAQQVLSPTDYGFPWLATNDGTNLNQVASDGQIYTMQGVDVPTILYHLNIPARQFNVEILGKGIPAGNDFADQESYLPSAGSPDGFFAFAWDGTRLQDHGNAKTKLVPNGTYRLKVSVLKPLGDPNKASDWETFTTPSFVVARP